MWEFISGVLKDPERIRAGMDKLIEEERLGSGREAAKEAARWEAHVEECLKLRARYQDQQAMGLMTLDELKTRLEELDGRREAALSELRRLSERGRYVLELEANRDALLETWATSIPDDLDALNAEEKNRIYRMLKLQVTSADERYRMSAIFGSVCTPETVTFKDTEGNDLQLYEPPQS